MSILGDNLTLLRKDRGYTRVDMVSLLDIPKYTYRNWEYGIAEPSIEYLIKISTLYQVSIDELVGVKKLSESNIYNKSAYYKNKEKLETAKSRT